MNVRRIALAQTIAILIMALGAFALAASRAHASPLPPVYVAAHPTFVLAPGSVATLASECYANDARVYSARTGRAYAFRWNRDHDRMVYTYGVRMARVVFDGIAFHNHTHARVVVRVDCD